MHPRWLPHMARQSSPMFVLQRFERFILRDRRHLSWTFPFAQVPRCVPHLPPLGCNPDQVSRRNQMPILDDVTVICLHSECFLLCFACLSPRTAATSSFSVVWQLSRFRQRSAPILEVSRYLNCKSLVHSTSWCQQVWIERFRFVQCFNDGRRNNRLLITNVPRRMAAVRRDRRQFRPLHPWKLMSPTVFVGAVVGCFG